MELRREDILAFAQRPWAAIEAEKREFLARAYREDPAAHFASVCALWDHLKRTQPDWPSAEDLAKDLADLVAWKRKIDRAASRIIDR
jgi:hypothetical protein